MKLQERYKKAVDKFVKGVREGSTIIK